VTRDRHRAAEGLDTVYEAGPFRCVGPPDSVVSNQEAEVGILWARNITQLAGMADRPPNTNLIRN
jgi:hypothetical protein